MIKLVTQRYPQGFSCVRIGKGYDLFHGLAAQRLYAHIKISQEFQPGQTAEMRTYSILLTDRDQLSGLGCSG